MFLEIFLSAVSKMFLLCKDSCNNFSEEFNANKCFCSQKFFYSVSIF